MPFPEFLQVALVVYFFSCLLRIVEGKAKTGKWNVECCGNPGNVVMVAMSVATSIGVRYGMDTLQFSVAFLFLLTIITSVLLRMQLREQVVALTKTGKKHHPMPYPAYSLPRLFTDAVLGGVLTIVLTMAMG
jgi:acid phosphatase family membrane protein YuiD